MDTHAQARMAHSNMLVNGSYERASGKLPDEWVIKRISGAVQIAVDTEVLYHGAQSLRLYAAEPARAAVGQSIGVTAGQRYELSQWVKTEAIDSYDRGVTVRLRFVDSTGAVVGADMTLGRVKGTTGWTQLRIVFQAPAGATGLDLENWLWTARGTVWFDDAVLQPTEKLPFAREVRAYYGFDDKLRVSWNLHPINPHGYLIDIYASARPLNDASRLSATSVRRGIEARAGHATIAADINATPFFGVVVRDAHGNTSSLAGARVETQILSSLRREHPRILASAADWERIRALRITDPMMQRWYAALRDSAQTMLTQSPATYQLNGVAGLLNVSRLVLRRIYTLGLLFQLDGDKAYLDRAWQELSAAAGFSDWCPDHFLDTAEMTHAFAIAYDWLYQNWSNEQRNTLRGAIIEKGLTPALRAYRGDTSGSINTWFWIDTTINWNIVVNSGISLGALAIADEAPDIAEQVMQYARASIHNGVSSYLDDGAWAEGLNYWNYASSYLVTFLAALDTALGADFGISARPGIDQTGFFPIYLTGPNGTFNYGDTWPDKISAPHLYWLARRFQQPLYASYEQIRAMPHPLDMLWYVPSSAQRLQGIPRDKLFDQVRNATFRSDWDDPHALYLAFKGGDNKAGHNDLDLGSFVLDANGVRWAEDLGMESYGLPDYFDYGPNGKRWTYYRKRAEGQNTLVINSATAADQNPLAAAPITAFESNTLQAFAVADLTAAYADAICVLRGIRTLGRRRQILVQDDIRLASPGEVWWFMHTKARVEVAPDGQSALLIRDTKRLWARILSPQATQFQVMDAVPLPTSPNPPGQTPNTGFRKLAIKLSASSDARLVVLLAPLCEDEAIPTDLPSVVPLNAWKL